MSFIPFKEVSIANPGSSTRYGSDDVLDVMKILNGKVVSSKRPNIINPWRWLAYQELKQVTEASVPTPSESDVVHLFLSSTGNKLKLKKTGGTVIDLEDVGTGTWNPATAETLTNKTVAIDSNTIKHSTTNAQGDIMRYDTTAAKYIRLAKGTANQSLNVNAAGTDLEWQTPAAGGGGSGEANTASNVGSAGIGVWYQKLGVDLQFKKVFSPDGSVNISDDTGNQKIDFTLPAGVVKTGTQNTFGDFQNTFRSGRLAITNPANTFAYFFVGSALTGSSKNITLPNLAANDQMTCDSFATTLLNKTLGSGTIAFTDTITLKHSTTNLAGELLVNNGTRFDRLPKGAANTILMVNSGGTDVTWGTSSGGVKLPDGTIAPTTGRWGAFYGGAGDGFGMMGFVRSANRVHGSALSATESATEIYTAATSGSVAEFKTGCGFRRDSSCIFKAKWRLTSATACKVKVGLSNGTGLGAGGGTGLGTPVVRYDVSQNSGSHSEMDTVSRFGVRINSGAAINEVVTEVVVRFRKVGSPSGNATVGVRKNSDGTLVTVGTFTPGSAGSGEQTATVTASSPTYQIVSGDYVTVEFPASATDGIELDEDTNAPPSGFTMHQWTGSSWSAYGTTLAMKITTAPVTGGGGGSGDTPLNGQSGIMVHGSIGTNTNYLVARNDGSPTQTSVDSAKALANITDHTVEININTTNCTVILDGTTFTYTTIVPSTSTPLGWWMQIESAAAAEKGIGIVYAQVVSTS